MVHQQETAMKAYARVLVGLTLSAAATASFADERVTAISVTTLGSASAGAIEVSRPLPAFPDNAQKNGNHRGQVLIGYNVAADGAVRDIRVLYAQPVQAFTRTAVNALKNWRYMPGSTDKRMVEFTFQRD
jgi:TonB family protein